MTRHEKAYQLVKVAGYHNDSRAATRVLVEYSIGIKRYNEAWREGIRARQAGISCDCMQCVLKGANSK